MPATLRPSDESLPGAFASSFSMRGKSRLIFNKHADIDYMRCKWPIQLSTSGALAGKNWHLILPII